MSARALLPQRVLQTLASGDPVPERDALQLRNWAVSPEEPSQAHRFGALRVARRRPLA